MRIGQGLAVVLAIGCLALPSASQAADGDKPTYEFGLYLWGASVAGDIDTPHGEASTHISFSDLLDNLNAAVMLRGRANFGKLSVVVDGEYMDLESDREQRTIRIGPEGNVEVQADAKAELDLYLLELSTGYQIFDLKGPFSAGPGDERGTTGELYVGGRYYSMKPTIDADLGPASVQVGEWNSWVDGIVGGRLAIDLSKTVVLGVQGDVGGFNIGNSNKFAWSQITSLTWRFSDSMGLSLGYKFLDIKREPSSDKTIKIQLRGPFVASFVRF